MKEVIINISNEQMEHVKELMTKHNLTQNEAILFLMQAGMREKQFRSDNE